MAASEELAGNDTPVHAEPVKQEDALQPIPSFWNGQPGTLTKGMVCRDGKLSVQVIDIVQCQNATIIIGLAFDRGEQFLWHVASPTAHPLSKHDATTEKQREFILSLWEYDKQ